MNNQVAKRYACDRCREQKLRCHRSQPADGPCERCARMGARCTMSTGRPLGRPPVQKSKIRAKDRVHARTDSPRTSYLTNGAIPMQTQPALPSTETIARSQRSVLSTLLFANDSVPFDTMRDVLNDCDLSAIPLFPTASGSLEFGTNEQQFPHTFGNVEGLELMVSENESEHAADDDSPNSVDSRVDDDTDDESRKGGLSTYVIATRGHSTAALTGILGNIACQLAELRDHSWDSWDPHVMQVAREHGLESEMSLSCGKGGAGPNSWDRTLSVTMRFAMVLQAMAPPRLLTITPPPDYTPPTLSATLLLLSSYVQLGELFDIVLRRINNCLQEPSGGHQRPPSSAQGSAAPRLPMKQPVGLHILMMIQFFETQLHGIEDFLGIPADCRMWSNKEIYAGILDQDELSGFARDVIRQTREPFRSLKRGIDCVRGSIAYSPHD